MIPPIVPSAWLHEHRDDVVIADVRWRLGSEAGHNEYLAGHLPGAVYVDLDKMLSGTPSPERGRHPLPAPDDFAYHLRALGIDDDSAVVAYDDAGGTAAARLVWMLRSLGEEAAVLDGGLASWSGDLETGEVVRDRGTFTVRAWPADFYASHYEAGDSAAPHRVVLDARAAERYRGDDEPIDPRAGHIPGAVNRPSTDNLDENGRFRSPEDLTAAFAALGIAQNTDVVAYCGSGVFACHQLLALEHAGLGPGRLYAGSWSHWSADPDRLAAVGAEPGGPAYPTGT